MSDPTYRIDIEPDPHTDHAPWCARIYSLADPGFAYALGHFKTTQLAEEWASEWVAAETAKKGGYSVYVDDDGQPVEAHSVKA